MIMDTTWRIRPPGLEDYDPQYGKISYVGMRVLDVGADYGSTADYFLRRGAREVIAVEANEYYYNILCENAKEVAGIVPVFMSVSTGADASCLLQEYKPDVLKVDCEGCERAFLLVEDWLFALPQAWVVETHSPELEASFLDAFERIGYRVLDVSCHALLTFGRVRVISATRIT